jgi:hypothetical protein
LEPGRGEERERERERSEVRYPLPRHTPSDLSPPNSPHLLIALSTMNSSMN